MARCIALTDGCVGTHYVRAGEAFEYAGPVPRWARPVEPVEPVETAAPAERKTAKKTAGGGKKAGK